MSNEPSNSLLRRLRINHEDKIHQLRDQNKQGDINTKYLLDAIDFIHDKLCEETGTWQERVEQVIVTVGKLHERLEHLHHSLAVSQLKNQKLEAVRVAVRTQNKTLKEVCAFLLANGWTELKLDPGEPLPYNRWQKKECSDELLYCTRLALAAEVLLRMSALDAVALSTGSGSGQESEVGDDDED